MIRLRFLGAAAMVCMAIPLPILASTYFPEQKKCPVGGESFKYMALASISQWGSMPDGMPIGSGYFPTQPPKCPGNGLVMYRDFTPAEVKLLTTFVASDEYKGLLAAGETTYYLAYRTAKLLGDADATWLVLNASWEAKNEPTGERARRYNEEFVALAGTTASDPTSFESIALRARAANALRELGRFDEAEAVRAAITIAPEAGGKDEDAARNREGWKAFLASLAAPIARKDTSRGPIDMIGDRQAMMRCLSKDAAEKLKMPAPTPLTEFETAYCARPELAAEIENGKKQLAE